jgi:hypothetical protein
MFTRKYLYRLVRTALLALIRGAAADLGTRLIESITWWLSNH